MEVSGVKETIYTEFLASYGQMPEAERDALINLALNDDDLYDSRSSAVMLRDKLSEVEDESTGVIFHVRTQWFGGDEYTLQAQVEEFVQWLKAVGLI